MPNGEFNQVACVKVSNNRVTLPGTQPGHSKVYDFEDEILIIYSGEGIPPVALSFSQLTPKGLSHVEELRKLLPKAVTVTPVHDFEAEVRSLLGPKG